MTTTIRVTPLGPLALGGCGSYLISEAELHRLIWAPADGPYRFTNLANGRRTTVTPNNLLTEARVRWLLGRRP